MKSSGLSARWVRAAFTFMACVSMYMSSARISDESWKKRSSFAGVLASRLTASYVIGISDRSVRS